MSLRALFFFRKKGGRRMGYWDQFLIGFLVGYWIVRKMLKE